MTGLSFVRLLGHHGNHFWCVLIQASLFGTVVLRLVVFLAPWSNIDPSLLVIWFSVLLSVDESDGKWSNCEGRLVMHFARYFLYFQLCLYLALSLH